MHVHRALVAVAMALYAAVDLAVIVAPSVVLRLAAEGGGVPSGGNVDLVVTSLVVGTVHAVVSWRGLRDEHRRAVRHVDAWIAGLVAISVLALGATLGLQAVLLVFVEEHARLAGRGAPVAGLLLGVLLVAIAVAEASRRAMFRWLEPDRVRRRDRWRVPFAAGAAPPDVDPTPAADALGEAVGTP